ncbi:serine hydrolase domain-containing protein [Brevibacillus reuszeri]|uniref:serine hydrolase domain-containing protein n=1 Tax=Brevibacillus reuszeri TaxID=54915 RepID=UPI0013DF7A56|nr:serine hydrolase domain-containing protein [Brevibacillus reuszeri]
MSSHNWTQSFEEYTQKLLNKKKTPGAILALAQDGELVYHHSFGYSDVEHKTAITLDTVFGIGSCTKSFACAAIMHLQDAGKLSVHDPVVKYLPEFRTPDAEKTKQISIHHFMTHTTGLPPLPALSISLKRSFEADLHMREVVEQMKEVNPIDTYEELMEFIASQPFDLLGEPGDEFSYSNDAYALLGAIIERVSGKSFEAYLKESILEPSGMTDSVFHLEELQGNTDIATLYSCRGTGDDKEVFASPAPWDAPPMRAAGFLKSTARDLLKYLEIFRTQGLVGQTRILSATSSEQMLKPFVEISQGHFYGYGFLVRTDYHGATLVEHGGNIKGVSAQIFLIPEQGITGAVLSNIVEAPLPSIMEECLNGYQSRPVQARAIVYQKQELSADHANQYVGNFATLEGNRITISYEDGALLLNEDDNAPLFLRHIGEDSFVFKKEGQEITIRFIRNREGHVIRVLRGLRQLTKSE